MTKITRDPDITYLIKSGNILSMPEAPQATFSAEIPAPRTSSPRAVLSLVLGIAVVTLVPLLTALVAPCGFPVAMLGGITAVALGKRGKKETQGSSGLATAGIVTGWVGIVANTLIMLVKLAMFVVIWLLPLLAVWFGTRDH